MGRHVAKNVQGSLPVVPPATPDGVPLPVGAASLGAASEQRRALAAPHLDSFDFFLQHGLALAVADLDPVEVQTPGGVDVRLSLSDVSVGAPAPPDSDDKKLYPIECREAGTTYAGPLRAQLRVATAAGERVYVVVAAVAQCCALTACAPACTAMRDSLAACQ